ncbi:hypothetical protein Taro_012573 [Colocasia esculenta]|uniref:Uncharacterized protein n=1 Tax=Colocasia esculenta TaxID=4460 RepID=A0A843U9B2_COLES|nr:hypothetical protein [Colocasia esculenta]
MRASDNYRVYASFCSSSAPAAASATVSNWLESYNPTDNSWRPAGTVPGLPQDHVLKDFAMITLGGSIFIIGGRLCRKVYSTLHCSVVDMDVAVVPTVIRHDVSTGQWCACSPLATPRFNFAAAACAGGIYVAGGLCGLSGGARGTSSAEVYDPVADRWAPLPNMSARRYKCVGVAWLPGKVHVIGGFAEPQEEDEEEVEGNCSGGSHRKGGSLLRAALERSSAEVFDVLRGEWELAPGMWQLDVPPNEIVSMGGRLYSSGDCLNNWKGHIEVYDGKLGIWNILEGSHLDDLSSLSPSVLDGARGSSVGEQEEVEEEEEEAVATGGAVQRLYLTMAPVGTQLYCVAGYRVAPPTEASSSSLQATVVHTFDMATASVESTTTRRNTGGSWRSFEPVMEQSGTKELCGRCCVVQVA